MTIPVEISPKAAGASGYVTMECVRPEGWENASVASYEYYTGSVLSSNGMQISVIYAYKNTVGFNYYFPKATSITISGEIRLTLRR